MFSLTTDPLPAEVISLLNPCSILQSFSNCERLTIFLNNLFNNYDVYTLDKNYFFLFLKDMIQKKQIQRRDLSFFKHHKEDKIIKMVHERFPHLKRMEVLTLIDLVKDDEELYPKFAETVGLDVPKKKKLTKKEKDVIEKAHPTSTIPKVKNKTTKVNQPKIEKTKPVVKAGSFDSWKQGFGKKEN